jgi:ubiquitin-like protein Pup
MATRETGGGQSKATRRQDEADEAQVADEGTADVKERHEKLSEDVDAILDEIDEVLEENAEEFVRQYVQKGGE